MSGVELRKEKGKEMFEAKELSLLGGEEDLPLLHEPPHTSFGLRWSRELWGQRTHTWFMSCSEAEGG